ncbi:Photosystem II reaction center protein J [Bienertia sinuspersici]
MADTTGRIPLWIIGTVTGIVVIGLLVSDWADGEEVGWVDGSVCIGIGVLVVEGGGIRDGLEEPKVEIGLGPAG